jgi:hypothetical protein
VLQVNISSAVIKVTPRNRAASDEAPACFAMQECSQRSYSRLGDPDRLHRDASRASLRDYGDKNDIKTATGLPPSKGAINSDVVDLRATVGVFCNRQFFPLAPQVQDFQDVIEQGMEGQLRRSFACLRRFPDELPARVSRSHQASQEQDSGLGFRSHSDADGICVPQGRFLSDDSNCSNSR